MCDPFEGALLSDDDGDLREEFSQVRARMQRTGFGSIGLGKALPRLQGAQIGSGNGLGADRFEIEEPKLGMKPSARSRAMANSKPSGGNRREAFATMVSRRSAGFDERDERFLKAKADGGSLARSGANSVVPSAIGHSKIGLGVGGTVTPLTRATALAGGAQACVVKLVSTGGGRASAGAMIAYNSREGKEPIERENGALVLSREDVSKLLDEWETFFDKREPSKDVMTLTVTFEDKLSDSQQAAFKAAVESAYKEQRFVSGFGVDGEGHDVFKAVVSIASRGSGRIKTTDHARDMMQASVEGAQELGTPMAVFALSEAAHGVEGLESHLKRALQTVPTLSGPKDKLIDGKTVSRDAAKWREELRSYGNRDVMHLVISSKAGTDETAFVNAARDFLGSEFGNHKYAFALHGPNDSAVDKKSGQSKATDHVHVHAMIVMKGIDGKKLNPRIQDFKNWRESMALHARTHGINMVATSRTETLNAINFTKGEHELVKAGLAPDNIVAKVADKQAGNAVLPTRPSGTLNAHIGRSVFAQLAASSREDGNEPVALEAARMAKRFDDLFKTIDDQTTAIKQHGDLAVLIRAIQDAATMLNSNVQKVSDLGSDMASRQAVEAAVERLAKTGAAISESLRGDPALKQAFDSKVMPQVIALKSLGDKSKTAQVQTAQDTGVEERLRTLQAQAPENVQALVKKDLDKKVMERQAGVADDASVRSEKSGTVPENLANAATRGRSIGSQVEGVTIPPINGEAPETASSNVTRRESEIVVATAETSPEVQGDEHGSKAKSKVSEKPKGRSR